MLSFFAALQYFFKWLALKEEINLRFSLQKEHERMDDKIYELEETISYLRTHNDSISNMRADRLYSRQLQLISYQETLPTNLSVSTKEQDNSNKRGTISATN